LIAKVVLAENPELLDGQIGKITQTDHKTVGAERTEQEQRREIPTSKTPKDTKGRRQPARRKGEILPAVSKETRGRVEEEVQEFFCNSK